MQDQACRCHGLKVSCIAVLQTRYLGGQKSGSMLNTPADMHRTQKAVGDGQVFETSARIALRRQACMHDDIFNEILV